MKYPHASACALLAAAFAPACALLMMHVQLFAPVRHERHSAGGLPWTGMPQSGTPQVIEVALHASEPQHSACMPPEVHDCPVPEQQNPLEHVNPAQHVPCPLPVQDCAALEHDCVVHVHPSPSHTLLLLS